MSNGTPLCGAGSEILATHHLILPSGGSAALLLPTDGSAALRANMCTKRQVPVLRCRAGEAEEVVDLLIDTGASEGLCSKDHRRLGVSKEVPTRRAQTAGGVVVSNEGLEVEYQPLDTFDTEEATDILKTVCAFYDRAALPATAETRELTPAEFDELCEMEPEHIGEPIHPPVRPASSSSSSPSSSSSSSLEPSAPTTLRPTTRRAVGAVGDVLPHSISHSPHDSSCEVCLWAKSKSSPHRHATSPAPGGDFGDRITLDFKVMSSLELSSTVVTPRRESLLVICDLGTGYVRSFYTKTRHHLEVLSAANMFLDGIRPSRVHSDGAPEIEQALRLMGLSRQHTTSTVGDHRSNGLAESMVSQVTATTRALLFQSGLSHEHWRSAGEYASILVNSSRTNERGETSYFLRHKVAAPQHHPFGCALGVILSLDARKRKPAFSQTRTPAIFLGGTESMETIFFLSISELVANPTTAAPRHARASDCVWYDEVFPFRTDPLRVAPPPPPSTAFIEEGAPSSLPLASRSSSSSSSAPSSSSALAPSAPSSSSSALGHRAVVLRRRHRRRRRRRLHLLPRLHWLNILQQLLPRPCQPERRSSRSTAPTVRLESGKSILGAVVEAIVLSKCIQQPGRLWHRPNVLQRSKKSRDDMSSFLHSTSRISSVRKVLSSPASRQ